MDEPFTYDWVCPICGYKVIFEQYNMPLTTQDIDEVGKIVHIRNTFDSYVRDDYNIEVLNNRTCSRV